jgi:hypothetical protein
MSILGCLPEIQSLFIVERLQPRIHLFAAVVAPAFIAGLGMLTIQVKKLMNILPETFRVLSRI